MAVSTSPCFQIDRMHYYPSVVDDHESILVGVFVITPHGRACAFYPAPLEDADPMDQTVVNATLAELQAVADPHIAYRSIAENSGNSLRLDGWRPIQAEDAVSAAAEAMRTVVNARGKPSGQATATSA